MKLGFIGLGKMGSRMVVKLLSEGHEVVVWNRSQEKIENLIRQLGGENSHYSKNLTPAESIKDLVKKLVSPRIVWSMLPARSGLSSSGLRLRGRSDSRRSKTGDATEEILREVGQYVSEGDIVIDGGNSNFNDTQRRYDEFEKKDVLFLGIGVSGGMIAAKEGYPLMVGGSRDAYGRIKPILDSLAKPAGGHQYFGEGGAGHFVKMVHNGIEYGVMQSIGEGFGVLANSPYNLDLVKVAQLFQKGTLVSGFMMQRTIEALEADPKLESVEGFIEDSGEGRWTIEQAKREKVPIEIIEKSLEFRVKSRKDPEISSTFAARLVAALRAVFGGHEVKKVDKRLKTKD